MTRDQVHVALIATVWSLAVGLAGTLLSWWLRRSSIRWSAGLIAVAAVSGIVAGVVGTARAMFLSPHDLSVVILVCAVSGTVSLAFALWLTRTLVAATRTLRDGARSFGSTGSYRAPSSGPREFRAVADELARSSARLRESTDREHHLEQSRRELVAWVSHDLRTPLAGLRAMAEALQDGITEDPSRYHTQMLSEVDRMASMVDDLFELSRIHAGALNLSLGAVELADVVSESIASTGPVARAKRVRVGGAVAADLVVQADPGALSRVVTNLLTNAIRHTSAEGAIDVQAHRASDAVELTVTDACGGIAPSDLERVFDVGWRGTDARTPAADAGAGLGLAIVKGLVEAQEGTVCVANHAAGCRFVVRLPERAAGC